MPKFLLSFLALTLAVLVSPARAEPCSATNARFEIAVLLRKAAEARPVHVTFRTDAEDVKLSPALLARYPQEMTIILQYQFTKLKVLDDRFEVGLWFKRRHERLVVPFAAVRKAWDGENRICGEG